MNAYIDWIQNNWYEAGSFLVQFTFLMAGIWFARKILRTLRASQEQVGALLRLSVSDGMPQQAPTGSQAQPVPEANSLTGSSPYWLVQTETQHVGVLDAPERGPGPLASAGHGVARWLQTPMGTGPSPLRRIIRWLQAPAGS